MEARARKVLPEMKLAAAEAIAAVIAKDELHPSYIVPSVFDRRVATAVAHAATEAGVARRQQKQG